MAVAAATALLVTPTMASAAGTASQQPASDWVTFSQLNPAGAMALGGSAAAPTAGTLTSSAAAVQPVDANGDYRPNPLPWPVIGVLLAVLGTAIYIAFIEKDGHHRAFLTSPE